MSLADIHLIKKEDIPNLIYQKMDWDVVVNRRPYQVIKVPGFAHCIGGKLDWGEGNCFWAYPLDEELTINNLEEFDGVPGARWGIEYYPTNYFRNKWDENSIERGRYLVITRNEEVFYDGFMTIHEALSLVLDGRLDEHPLELNERDFDKKMIGRKVWFDHQPAIIERYIKGQACVILVPDNKEAFDRPGDYENDGWWEESKSDIKCDIFSTSSNWFRD